MPIKPNTYGPANFKALTFHDRLRDFEDGSDSPRAYLERCLETVAAEGARGPGLRVPGRRSGPCRRR